MTVLLVLVLLGSALSVVLALTRPGAEAEAPPTLSGADGTAYAPADLVGPGGDALAAVVTSLPLTLSYDHDDLRGSLADATAQMTPRYARQFTRSFNRRVRPFAQRRRAVVEGLVRGAGVVRARDDTSVVCLVYADQLLVEARGMARGEKPRVLGRNRVRVELVLRDGTWRIDAIRTL